MNALYGSFANYGFVRDVVSDELMAALRAEVNELDDTAVAINNNLAGNIESEFKLSKNSQQLEKYVLSLCEQYTSGWSTANTTRDLTSHNLELQTYWVNLQKKHEFNPIHSHDGIYSFVIWLQVPYAINEELEYPSASKSNMPRPGMFSFIYSNIFGELREAEFPVDNTYEGTIFLFPSCLNHTVYPFRSSDKTRISISGNLVKKQ